VLKMNNIAALLIPFVKATEPGFVIFLNVLCVRATFRAVILCMFVFCLLIDLVSTSASD